MSWHIAYRAKLTTLQDVANSIESGQRIYVSGNAATPRAFFQALTERSGALEDVEIVHVLLLGQDPLEGAAGRFRHNSLFVGPADRRSVNEGTADYTPVFLHRIASLFTTGLLPLDAAFLHTSPPDRHGFLSLGVEVLASLAAARTAHRVIAQVNPRMPRVLGDAFLHVTAVDAVVEVDEPLFEIPPVPFTETEAQIATHVASLIDDGATLQLGIGGIPNAVLHHLRGKKDLGIHTEMVSDAVMEAIEAGVVTGARKTLHAGKAVATFILGTQSLYDYVSDNPNFELHPAEYTNDPWVIAQNDRMVAINSAIEVDITGQVSADSIGRDIYSGFGGQVDFVRGAMRAREGKAIIALPATAKAGERSRIVPFLAEGAGVVTTRADVDYVVTEFGSAHLTGRTLRQRAQALREIAHPDFQEALAEEAWRRRLVPRTVAVGPVADHAPARR